MKSTKCFNNNQNNNNFNNTTFNSNNKNVIYNLKESENTNGEDEHLDNKIQPAQSLTDGKLKNVDYEVISYFQKTGANTEILLTNAFEK